jgi:hypothetical protein
MPPVNPGIYKLDKDSRLQLPKDALPSWLQESSREEGLFCVPLRWRRPAALLPYRELEAWCLWGETTTGRWLVDPREVMEHADRDPISFALQTLMYPATYGSKGRLSCPSIFDMMIKKSEKHEFWVAAELDSISIWTDAAFQYSYSNLGIGEP